MYVGLCQLSSQLLSTSAYHAQIIFELKGRPKVTHPYEHSLASAKRPGLE